MKQTKLKNISVFMSLILRHKPETIGIKLDEHGWVNVDELITGINKEKNVDLDFDTLKYIVDNDEKQRYSFNNDCTKIRANQGHPVNVDLELLPVEPPEYLYHGTAFKSVGSILKEGLTKRSRMYVHLSSDYNTAVKVGKRHGKPVIFIVESKKMYEDGYKFYLSENKVWLTDKVPSKYLVMM